jgi:hypothetical protein
MLAAAAGFLAVALLIRAGSMDPAVNGSGRLEQYSGSALYASVIYVGALFLWPRLSPLAAGAIALGWCWGAELFQLTGIPAELSERSLLARLVLGMKFDYVDMLWYPVGIVPLVLLHLLLRRPH